MICPVALMDRYSEESWQIVQEGIEGRSVLEPRRKYEIAPELPDRR